MKRSIVTVVIALCVLGSGLVNSPGSAVAGSARSVHPGDNITLVAANIWTASTKCQVVKYGNGAQAIGYITGRGTGRTEQAARAAALRSVDALVIEGHYKRHCKTTTSRGTV